MNLVSPERWVWLAIGIPIVLAYLLRTRLRRQPVSTLLFWDQVFDPKRQRSWWQRLRHWLSLLLQLAFLMLVVSALLDPLWPGQRENARQIVLVVDNSASMSVVDEPGGTTRLEEAIQSARGIVDELREGDEIALVTAGGGVRVAAGMTDFGPAIGEALDQIQPTDSPTSLADAIDAARAMTRSPDRRDVIVISDGDGLAADDPVWDGDDLRWVSIGQPADNVAITRMAARRSLVDPIGYSVLIEVRHFGEQPTTCRLNLDLNENVVDVIPLSLQPGEVWRKTLVDASADGGKLTATIDHADALAVDNTASVILPERPPIPVILVSESPSVYLESVLGAIPLVQLTVTSDVPESSPTGGFVVLHRIDAAELPAGSVLVIDPIGDSNRWTLGEPIDDAIVAKQDVDSPLMPHVRLQNVVIPGARGLRMTGPATELLIDAGGETLMASVVDGDDRVLVLAANLDDGDLPLRIAFPVWMTNAVNWFLSRSGEIQPAMGTAQRSRIAVATTPDDRWVWVDSAGESHPATAESDAVWVGPVDRTGLVTLRRTDDDATQTDVRTMAVNLVDARESDLRQSGNGSAESPVLSRSGWRSIWFYLTVLSLVMIVGEWILYQRRIVG